MKRHIAILSGAVLAGGMLAGCVNTGTGANPAEREAVAVKVIEVSMDGSAATKTYIGTVHPARSTVLSCSHSGTLVELNARQGQHVRQGDVIAVINSQGVKSSLDIAAATLQQARDGYRRAKSVHGSGSMADVKMIEVETQLRQAEAAYAAAEKAYSDCTIKAPFSGAIGEVYAEAGVEMSVAGPIVKIMDISSVEIRFPVPEGEINSVRTGTGAIIGIQAIEKENIPVRITSKGIAASALAHTYECTAVPDARIDGLMPGMVCKVRIPGGNSRSAVIPSSVIKTDASGRYVWAVKDLKAVRLPVVTGGFSGNGVIISEGLQAGDLVIVEGARKVSSGMKVKIVE
ncbi:MAG: efflux RND transporter periplasmic adaptor subunit [Clostridium sp.]|nr:efflux RND transporter periplasmic adaptor subunit [Bacteroides sp.]MCM1197761.1 efflux RND transporter periplasmic adaptor subunit [Clostridium sp.]